MSQVTITLKLKFSGLNQAKAIMFGEMTEENTRLANWLLTIPLPERRKLTTAGVETSLMSEECKSDNSAYHIWYRKKSQRI